jgi:Family of unknown function (DUF6496)
MTMSTKYGKKLQEEVGQALHEEKHHELKSGSKSGKTVTRRQQAIAIGLAKAREAGAKVPSKRNRSRQYAALRCITRHYAALTPRCRRGTARVPPDGQAPHPSSRRCPPAIATMGR